ncbi:MAG: DUF4258 domain-containing protein [Candidatus Stahlbacteria bacterium]|nr:DUF4258 domain-containing protein [Candidatus Stahlbacteria bacterium]
MGILQQIREKVTNRTYYLSSHAEEEMWADSLERTDIENAILKGRIEKKLTCDLRGTRYCVGGPSLDLRTIHIICRFDERSELLIIITVYVL